ncbi:hypothetical protein [Rhizobium ruizarguesonis]|uniref:hypothetical protein n=1 Tax=Rhizobium ruizarguesonis TaxID=2081791 RepID=UPI001030AD87|nr:hypothetical protein [Rhizobium ruizarguesonis]TAU13402.1 hypothetical protein ELI48_36910 [Rhizobium ruizarguesonis]TAU57113.1 hypothetical protein ELI45_37800 [Rhizobium ruizarguesonis]TAV01731.1 hypothetical protein ELI34_38380 [Rhizobium ruizarguesonis]TAV28341.1 hypothetical protein ELI35_12230 [Rhizobium ruizarguesonis]TAW60347.1 hypothetical protein ELI16_37480 [Rhizobium ruizarguesonis]
MSGPKVVRVVTREEIIAICQGHIAALVAAFEQWQRVGKRNEIVEAEDIRLAQSRISAMGDLLAKDKFAELQKQAPLEIAFLKADMETRIERAAEKAARDRNEGKRRLRAANSLAMALSEKGFVVPPALSNPGSCSQEELQAAVIQGFALLAPLSLRSEITDRQRELAAKLGEGESHPRLADWLATQQPSAVEDPRLADLERRYEELRALDPERASKLSDRVEKISSDRSSRRSLLIDSLALDIAAERRAATDEADALVKLRAIEAQLKNIHTPASASQLSKIENLLSGSPTVVEMSNIIATATATLQAIIQERAEQDRRSAILAGFGELGYEVKEGMQTAWVENGRVVLKSNKRPGYGVEIGGNPNSGMQLRTVGFAASADPRDAIADISAETEFCGDFSVLQATLAASGGELVVMKALGVGTTAVKRISAVPENEISDTNARGTAPTVRRL